MWAGQGGSRGLSASACIVFDACGVSRPGRTLRPRDIRQILGAFPHSALRASATLDQQNAIRSPELGSAFLGEIERALPDPEDLSDKSNASSQIARAASGETRRGIRRGC